MPCKGNTINKCSIACVFGRLKLGAYNLLIIMHTQTNCSPDEHQEANEFRETQQVGRGSSVTTQLDCKTTSTSEAGKISQFSGKSSDDDEDAT